MSRFPMVKFVTRTDSGIKIHYHASSYDAVDWQMRVSLIENEQGELLLPFSGRRIILGKEWFEEETVDGRYLAILEHIPPRDMTFDPRYRRKFN